MGAIVAITIIVGSCAIVVGLTAAIVVRQRVHKRRMREIRERRRRELEADPRYQKRRRRALEQRDWDRRFKNGG